MAWIARDKDNKLFVYRDKPKRNEMWSIWESNDFIFAKLSDNADSELINRTITWKDEPVEI